MVTLLVGLFYIEGILVDFGNAIHEISIGFFRAVSQMRSACWSSLPRSAVAPNCSMACLAAARYSGLAATGLVSRRDGYYDSGKFPNAASPRTPPVSSPL